MNTIYFSDRKKWRRRLEDNFKKETEIWLIFPRKNSDRPRISYNDAVEEALCFGWIDSIVKTFDEENTMQRFSPRKSNNNYSQQNRERLRWLQKENLLHHSIKKRVAAIIREEFVFPADILNEIKNDPITWKHYNAFSDAYKRIRISYIDAARKRPEEFRKRLNNFLIKTRLNKQIGFGGIEKYY